MTASSPSEAGSINPELGLVAACCRWPHDDVRAQRVTAFAAGVQNWKHVVALTSAHRAEGLVHDGLRHAAVAAPREVAAQLAGMAERVRARSLNGLAEEARLCLRLSGEGIEYRILKGLPVARLAYDSLTIKHSVDIDILVRPRDAVRTAGIIRDLGYSQFRPWRELDETEFRLWAAVAKEAAFCGDKAQVDLHWDLVDVPALLVGLDPWAEPRMVTLLDTIVVPTLPDPENLAYLAAHGAMTGWSRLKWLADFAAFLSAMPVQVRDAHCQAARRMAGDRAVDQALILINSLFGPGLPNPAAADAATTWLVHAAQSLIERRHPDDEPEKGWKSARLLAKMQARLRKDRFYRASNAGRRWREEEIRFRLRLRLPARMSWAYWPFRLPGALIGSLVRLWYSRPSRQIVSRHQAR